MTDITETPIEAAAPVIREPAVEPTPAPAPQTVEAAIAMMREAKKVVDTRNKAAEEEAKAEARAKQREIGRQLGVALSFFGINADPDENKFMIGEVQVYLRLNRSSWGIDRYYNESSGKVQFQLDFNRMIDPPAENEFGYEGITTRTQNVNVWDQEIAGDWSKLKAQFIEALDEVTAEAEAAIAARQTALSQPKTTNRNQMWIAAASDLKRLASMVEDGIYLSSADVLILATAMHTYRGASYEVE